MADESEEKQLKDFSAEVKALVEAELEPAVEDPTRLPLAIEKFSALEKKTRLAADANSTAKLAESIIQLCYRTRSWSLLNENISLLCKRRAQLKKVVQSIIRLGAQWIQDFDSLMDIDSLERSRIKKELIATVRDVSAGKMFVELERARITQSLAQMLENEGKSGEAADVLQDVQVETIGAMEVQEKAAFLLEQMRLFLVKKDFIRTEIIYKKIQPSVLEKPDAAMQDLKIKYYSQLVEYHLHNRDYLGTCRAYNAIFHTPKVQADKQLWQPALQNVVIFLILSQYDSEVSDLLHRTKAEAKSQEIPSCKAVLDLFTTDELVKWPLPIDAEWKASPVFSDAADGARRWLDLQKRVIQHNLRTIGGYYHQITSARLSILLELSASKTEEYLSEMVSSKQLYARIDRPAGVITFTQPETPSSILNSWAGDVDSLMGLVEKTTHLIHKELMVHESR